MLQMYNKLSKSARIAEAELWDVETAPAEIDVGVSFSLIHKFSLLTVHSV